MAVSRMRKVQILAHRSAKDDVVAALREGGVLHIGEPSVELEQDPDGEARRERERELGVDLGKLEHIRRFLKRYAPKKKSFDAMFNPKVLLDDEELRGIVEDADVDRWYDRCVDLEGRMRSGEAEIARKEALASELAHWSGLGMPVEGVVDTGHVSVVLLSVESSDLTQLGSELEDVAPESDLIEVSSSGSTSYLVGLFLKSAETVVTPLLKRWNARRVDLTGARGTPCVAAERLRAEAERVAIGIEETREKAAELARDYERVLVVLDERAEDLAKTSIEERFGATRETFLVEGWIRARDEKPLQEKLLAVAPETEIVTREPEPGETVPIDLQNNAIVSPFEFVTTLYGRPVYWEFDPTPFLAPFFILFFGLCVSDGGYGLTLAALSFVLMRKMQPGGGRKLMQLMFMGGISTAVVGAVTGGWFGIDPAIFPGWVRSVIVMNPLKEPMKMLNVVFILGIIQIFVGLGIKMAGEFREGRWLDGVLDQLVWILFLLCLAPLGYGFVLGGDIPPLVSRLATRGAMVMGLIVVATGARKNRNPVMKVLGGVLKLYDIVGYFGDVLSYARLLALGLATGAIAVAINGVAQMAMGIPYAGPVAAVIILIGGHLFNIAVNCLGGFVHSGRLQYLEFFSKFFQGGGTAFTPFRIEKRYSMVRK